MRFPSRMRESWHASGFSANAPQAGRTVPPLERKRIMAQFAASWLFLTQPVGHPLGGADRRRLTPQAC